MNQAKQTLKSIQTDFDRIALLAEEDWNHNTQYHDYLLGKIPARCENALEIGCGTGQFSRRLAERAEKVTALDLSPQMIRLAGERSTQYPNIDFVTGDAMAYPLADNSFDFIATLTTLHHVPPEDILRKIRRALKPGGVFVCLDLYQRSSLTEWFLDTIAYPSNLALTLIKTGHLNPPKEVREAYAEHGKTDTYLTLPEIKNIGTDIMPGAQITRHLFWRYSIVWRKGNR